MFHRIIPDDSCLSPQFHWTVQAPLVLQVLQVINQSIGEQPLGTTACTFLSPQGGAIGVCTGQLNHTSQVASTVPTGQSKHLVLQVLVNNHTSDVRVHTGIAPDIAIMKWREIHLRER
jgi:hypothetical protein